MDPSSAKMAPQQSLFQVYLRLRPVIQNQPLKEVDSEPWLLLEPPSPTSLPDEESVPSVHTHITLRPPNDSRKRAVEKFGFTEVFQEDASQLEIFESTGTPTLIKNLLNGGKDGLVATLGVTGSGKSHTILGSRSQRGLTQMTLDVLFRSIGSSICSSQSERRPDLLYSLQASDPSEARISSASSFIEAIYGDSDRGRGSRAQTPMSTTGYSRSQTPNVVGIPGSFPISPKGNTQSQQYGHSQIPLKNSPSPQKFKSFIPSKLPFWNRPVNVQKPDTKPKRAKESMLFPKRHQPPRPSALPLQPDVASFATGLDDPADYVVLVSMYEVYNDRIFDLLSSSSPQPAGLMTTRQGAALQKDLRRRPLLFKSTEMSPDRKVVAGLQKVVCGTYEEAMTVLETGLAERRVTGTGSNTASSRSHGFFCIEVKRQNSFGHFGETPWSGGVLSIVDLAGSERARNAKTTGSTLAEAGKINESLMYLGQCLQVQSEQHDGSKPIVPFRQCKLTELLFTNSFSAGSNHTGRAPQKAVMIVTADPHGDFNATSQILRYSALAREVTVPRIPSVTSTILNGPHPAYRQGIRQAQHGDQLFSAEELQQAANEIARLSEECDQITVKLAEEEIKREESELKLQAALQASEDKALLIEQETREECWAQMEAEMRSERERWMESKEEDRVRAEGYMDQKITIVEKGVAIVVHEDTPEAIRAEELERDNDSLRRKIEDLQRQLNLQQSPTKSKSKSKSKRNTQLNQHSQHNQYTLTTPLRETNSSNVSPISIPLSTPFLSALRKSSHAGLLESLSTSTSSEEISSPMKNLELQGDGVRKVSIPKTPATGKKQRKLTTRKWDLQSADDDEENGGF